MTNNRINTDLSGLVSVLKEKEEIKLTEAALMLGLSEHETETLAKKLADYGILEMRYSLKGYKTLRIGANIPEVKETVKAYGKKHAVSFETEKIFNMMRHKRAEKKGRPNSGTAIQETENDRTDIDYERHKRLREIKEGLTSVRENLGRIRTSLESDLKDRNDAELIRAK
jgi:hypothetical protein